MGKLIRNIDANCSNCVYWDLENSPAKENGKGICRRWPPVFHKSDTTATQVHTISTRTCGEHPEYLINEEDVRKPQSRLRVIDD